MLAGVADDVYNIEMLPGVYIVRQLRFVPKSVPAFHEIVPTMLPEEQTRCYALLKSAQSYVMTDGQDELNAIQRKNVRLTVRRGGGWMPPPLDI